MCCSAARPRVVAVIYVLPLPVWFVQAQKQPSLDYQKNCTISYYIIIIDFTFNLLYSVGGLLLPALQI
jgi:hypothetical protein